MSSPKRAPRPEPSLCVPREVEAFGYGPKREADTARIEVVATKVGVALPTSMRATNDWMTRPLVSEHLVRRVRCVTLTRCRLSPSHRLRQAPAARRYSCDFCATPKGKSGRFTVTRGNQEIALIREEERKPCSFARTDVLFKPTVPTARSASRPPPCALRATSRPSSDPRWYVPPPHRRLDPPERRGPA